MSAAKLRELCLRHLPWTLLSLLRLALARGGGILTLTHAADVDRQGRDAQMGPLVDALRARGERRLPVVLVPLEPGALAAARRREDGPFLSLAALWALARLVALGASRPRARARVARAVLWACRPRVAFLIDESGSGQAFVAAGRARGVRTVGIQHGDFQPRNRQYASVDPSRGFETLAADVLCVWSPWFRARLLARSPIYTAASTRVTGRLAHALERRDRSPRAASRTPRVLVLADGDASFAPLVEPFLAALRADGLRPSVRAHPADREDAWPADERSQGSLEEDLERADVVLGRGSSALLEALRRGRTPVVLQAGDDPDPAGYVAEGVALGCDRPPELPALCRRLAAAGGGRRETLSAAARVWGGAPPDPVAAVLACGGLEGDSAASTGLVLDSGPRDGRKGG